MTSTALSWPARLVRILLAASLVVLLLGAVPGRAEAAATKPTGLSATASSATSVAVAWQAVSKAPAYKVKYSSSKKMSKPKYARTTTTSVTLSGLKAGTSYYVKVRTTKASGKSLSGYSATVKVMTAAAQQDPVPPSAGTGPDLRIASYNVTCDNCFDGQPNELHWSGRRDAVAASIKAQDLDVIGVQEAGQGWLKDSDGNKIDLSQFEDLRNALGGTWTLTNSNRNNCVKSKTPNNCVYKDQGASDGDRIYFDASRVTKLDSGSKLLPNVGGNNDRYVTWARFEQRSTGKQFMFGSTHLEPAKDASGSSALYRNRKAQAEVVVETLAKNNPDHLPAFIVGDMNSSRFEHDYSPTNAPYDVYTAAGYLDPLGGAWRTTKTAPGALVKHRINTWLNSFNGFDRTVVRKPGWINGSYIDYIMVSKGVEVPEWETVANLGKDGNLDGIVPSDHNMIRATVVLPS